MSAPHIILGPICHLFAKTYQSWLKFDEVLTKIMFHSFF